MAKNLLCINVSETGITSNFKKKCPQIPENELSNMKIKRILKQAIFHQYLAFIHHHQLLYVHPVLLLLLIIKGCSIDIILYDFISDYIHC